MKRYLSLVLSKRYIKSIWMLLLPVVVMLYANHEASAQKMRFKDVYPLVENRMYNEAVPKLRDFLIYEPSHPSANLQLGLIYEMRYTSYDILTKNTLAVKNALQAQKYLYNANTLVDEREVRRNSDFYSNFSKPNPKSGRPMVEYVDVREKINRSVAEVDTFLVYASDIYAHFTTASSFYERARQHFLTINNTFATLKEIYLKYDADLENSIKDMEMSYDSAIFHFEAYKELTGKYPIKYNQSIVVKPITLYRLDGLVAESTFLDPTVYVWDFSAWGKDLRRVVANEILSLRNQITENHQRLKKQIATLDQALSDTTVVLASSSLDRDVLLKLRRYDVNALVTPILNYQLARQELLFAEASYKRREVEQISTQVQSNFAASMLLKLGEADSLLGTIQNLNTADNQKKYGDFIQRQYGSLTGLEQFVEKEKKSIQVDKVMRATDLREAIIKSLEVIQVGGTINFRKMNIPLLSSRITMDSLQAGQTVTLFMEETPDGSFYLAGMHRNAGGAQLVEAFVAKLDTKKKIRWVNSFNIPIEDSKPNSHVRVVGMQSTAEGVAFILHAVHAEFQEARNLLVVLDENGKEISKRMLQNRLAPRVFQYLERNNSYIIGFKGEEFDGNVYANELLMVEMMDADLEVIWTYRSELAGTLDAIIPQAESFVLTGNFSMIKDENNQVKTLPASRTNAYAIRISPEGRELGRRLFSTERSFYISHSERTGQVFNLIGFQGLYANRTLLGREDDALIHIVFDKDLNVLYQLL